MRGLSGGRKGVGSMSMRWRMRFVGEMEGVFRMVVLP